MASNEEFTPEDTQLPMTAADDEPVLEDRQEFEGEAPGDESLVANPQESEGERADEDFQLKDLDRLADRLQQTPSSQRLLEYAVGSEASDAHTLVQKVEAERERLRDMMDQFDKQKAVVVSLEERLKSAKNRLVEAGHAVLEENQRVNKGRMAVADGLGVAWDVDEKLYLIKKAALTGGGKFEIVRFESNLMYVAITPKPEEGLNTAALNLLLEQDTASEPPPPEGVNERTSGSGGAKPTGRPAKKRRRPHDDEENLEETADDGASPSSPHRSTAGRPTKRRRKGGAAASKAAVASSKATATSSSRAQERDTPRVLTIDQIREIKTKEKQFPFIFEYPQGTSQMYTIRCPYPKCSHGSTHSDRWLIDPLMEDMIVHHMAAKHAQYFDTVGEAMMEHSTQIVPVSDDQYPEDKDFKEAALALNRQYTESSVKNRQKRYAELKESASRVGKRLGKQRMR